jgi:hypothetical protein
MDQRFSAWAQLLTLFPLIYSGGGHGGIEIPPREGYLFDPDRYLFFEGRWGKKDKPVIPRVSDGVIFRVLTKLLVDGQRLSYRTLAVEQIGSVYQPHHGLQSAGRQRGGQSQPSPPKDMVLPRHINLENLLKTPTGAEDCDNCHAHAGSEGRDGISTIG